METSEGGGPPERREQARHRTYKAGRLFSDDLLRSLDCTIRDLSPEGARLKLDSNLPLPKSCFLYFEAERTIAPVRIVWRIDQDIGIQIITPPQPTATHPNRAIRGIRPA